MKRLYYYVPKCPNCGSRITGRYVKEPNQYENKIYAMREYLKHGEIVSMIDDVPYNNCYCEECGHSWHYIVTSKLISKERIEEEKTVRFTKERYIEFNKEHPKKKAGFMRRILGFGR